MNRNETPREEDYDDSDPAGIEPTTQDAKIALEACVAEMTALKASHKAAEAVMAAKVVDACATWSHLKWGIKVGDIVIMRGAEYRVEAFAINIVSSNAQPWLTVRKKTRDGFAKATTTAYRWEKKP